MRLDEYQDKMMSDMLKRSKKISEDVFGKEVSEETIIKVCTLIHDMNEKANERLVGKEK